MTITSTRHISLLLCVTMLATCALYWPGLHGPFLFDDTWNLLPVQEWIDGTGSWQSVIFGNTSGALGRPLSMASFLLQAWLAGTDAFDFKFGNLVVHLACGLLAWRVLLGALQLDHALAACAALIAALLTSFWLLHPLHVSTVLYAVQRMAQLSTMFSLAAVVVYLMARRRLDAGQKQRALFLLFVAFPVLVACGMLSKENAAVTPALCLVMELAYFCKTPSSRQVVAWFFGIFLALPTLAAIGILVFEPDRLLAGYHLREFTLPERLLTQPRVLFGYIGQLLLPHGPSMGLYKDALIASDTLFSPPSTLLSLIGLGSTSALAIFLRKRAPSFFAGWFFFLVGHGIESSFLPLELAFEHRNYLPSIGLLLAVAGVAALAPKRLAASLMKKPQLALIAAAGFAAVLAFATLGRVLIWQHKETIVAQALMSHPNSRRAALDQASLYLEKKQFSKSIALLTNMVHSNDPRQRIIGRIDLVLVDCLRGHRGNPRRLTWAAIDSQPVVTLSEAYAWQALVSASIKHSCKAAPSETLIKAIEQVIAAATQQPETSAPKWVLRYNAAKLHMKAGQWDEAETQARTAWNASKEPPVGGLLVQAYVNGDKLDEARRVLARVSMRVKPFDREGQKHLARLQTLIQERQ